MLEEKKIKFIGLLKTFVEFLVKLFFFLDQFNPWDFYFFLFLNDQAHFEEEKKRVENGDLLKKHPDTLYLGLEMI